MSENFVKRNSCPCCESNSYKVIYSGKFSNEKIWPFLDSYYEGRMPKKSVESDYYNIERCNDCDLLFGEYILTDSNMFLLYEKWISAEKSLDKKKLAKVRCRHGAISIGVRHFPGHVANRSIADGVGGPVNIHEPVGVIPGRAPVGRHTP